jgi:Zn-dependent protease
MTSGALRIFRLAGIDVYVHWTWLIVIYFAFEAAGRYSSPIWSILEYVTLFAIVLMHEFGHAFACLSVGGRVQHIMLWPLGGIAFVSPPPRPGALLWSIVAGPLVNVVLVPVTVGLLIVASSAAPGTDLEKYVRYICGINIGLLVFNLLPIYPMDGGQILQALLWFVIGRVNSLIVVSIIGLIGGAGFALLAILGREPWFFVIAVFIGFRAYAGFQQAQQLSKLLNGPRHFGAACPSCGEAPFAGNFWACACGARFDAFEHQAVCPGCGNAFPTTMCPSCHRRHPIADWLRKATPESLAMEGEPPA